MPSLHWARPSALLPLAGLAASVVVHGLTFAGVDAARGVPAVWALHVGALAAFGAAVLSARRAADTRGARFALPTWPGWAWVLAATVLAYTFINFVLFLGRVQGGSPEAVDGGYVLSNHGHVIRPLTEAEYWQLRAYVTRGFSGHWLFFFLLPALYFLFRPEPARAPRTSTAGAPAA